MTPAEYWKTKTKLDAEISQLRQRINSAQAEAEGTDLPRTIRPTTPEDITQGAVIWYLCGDYGPYWNIVEEVINPNDQWKAYCGEDGCRYGLDDAWVEDVDVIDDEYLRSFWES